MDNPTFKEGDRIEHKFNGKGTVKSLRVANQGTENEHVVLTVKFDSGTTRNVSAVVCKKSK